MSCSRLLRRLRNDPRFLCKYLIWTNVFCLLYFIITTDQYDIPGNQPEQEVQPEHLSDFKFRYFNLDQWRDVKPFKLKHSAEIFFRSIGESECYIRGTDLVESERRKKCICVKRYFGVNCGIPESAWFSFYRNNSTARLKLKPRKVPRRLIHALQVNHEFDLFEARMEMLKDVVDVYLLLESNYTACGNEKQLLFMNKFRAGWLENFQDKIQYVFLSFFHEAAKTNGWFADSYLRLFLGQEGMKMVENARDDDVFLLLDADELPSPESLIFLKAFDGWTEPVKFGFRWNVFGFFWLEAEEPAGFLSGMVGKLLGVKERKTERLLTLYVACTVGMLRQGKTSSL